MVTPQQVASLIDLTTLSEEKDTHESVKELAELGEKNGLDKVAALCILPRFVEKCKENTDLDIATVVNFPKGESTTEVVEQEIKDALKFGADEIDIVIDYKKYIESKGESDCCFELVKKARECIDASENEKKAVLKVIIESGALKEESLIRGAAKDAIRAGTDFVKTSTGFVDVGATMDAALYILEEIKKHEESESENKRKVGFKASGGIRTFDEAKEYVELAEKLLGKEFVAPKTMRFGASSLLKNMMKDKEEAGKENVTKKEAVAGEAKITIGKVESEQKTGQHRAAPY